MKLMKVYTMVLVESVTSAFKNYTTFTGRASRGDYWWYVLGYSIVAVILTIVDKAVFGGGQTTAEMMGDTGPLAGIWVLINIIPLISAGVRRLHDTDRSGWFYLIALVPLVNLYLLYVLATKGTAGQNRFGADPLA